MKDVTLGEALDYISKLNDLSYIVKDNTIIVGEKGDLTSSFSEEAKITEFILTYVPAETIIRQINTFNIPVTATPSGGNEYRFLAQGLPEDLARVRNLINMVDRRENAVGGGTKPASSFYSIELTHITAAEFQRGLGIPARFKRCVAAVGRDTVKPSENALCVRNSGGVQLYKID